MLTGLHVIAVAIGGQDGRRMLCGYRDGVYAIAAESWSVMTAGVPSAPAPLRPMPFYPNGPGCLFR